MPTIINHLKNKEAQGKTLAMASGLHAVSGHLLWSYSIGAGQTLRAAVRHALGEGEWSRVIGAWYKGAPIKEMRFMPGKEASPRIYKAFSAAANSPDLSAAAHGYSIGDEVAFRGNELPDGLSPNQVYYIIYADANIFRVALAPGGGEIAPKNPGGPNKEVWKNDPLAGISPLFPTDTPHSETVILDYKTPEGIAIEDPKKEAPDGFVAICETEKFWDYDTSGNQIPGSFAYTVNGARIFAGWFLKKGGLSSRINWPNWAAWRDYLGALETQDHSAIAAAVGFGLNASFYKPNALSSPVAKRVEPFIDFQLAAGGRPAPGFDDDLYFTKVEGKVKRKYSEPTTLTLTNTHTALLYINGTVVNSPGTAGAHTYLFDFSASEFLNIKIEWSKDSLNTAGSLKLEWSSASQILEAVPPENLFPPAEQRPRYESHLALSDPADLDAAMKEIAVANNSLWQDADGKISWFCYEQLAPSFSFSESNILEGSLRLSPRASRRSDLKIRWEAEARDIDSQYLEKFDSVNPLFVEIADGAITNFDFNPKPQSEILQLPNMSRWQARKILAHMIRKRIRMQNIYEFEGNAETYPVVAGDLVLISHSLFEWDEKQFLVLESRDKSAEATADERSFIVQEWD